MRGLKLNKQSVITNRTENMGRYFSELSKMYCISPERELELSMTIRANTSTSEVSKAIEELVCANLRFVVTVAKKYEGCGMSLEDLISEGNIGCMRQHRDLMPPRALSSSAMQSIGLISPS